MSWDIGLPLIAFVAQCATAYVAWRATVNPVTADQNFRKRIFEAVIWVSFLVGAMTIVGSGIRGDATSKKLDDLARQQSKRAFVTVTGLELSQYVLGKPICVNVHYVNSGDDAAQETQPFNGVGITSGISKATSNVGGPYQAPDPRDVDTVFEKFAHETDGMPSNGDTLLPGKDPLFNEPCSDSVVTHQLDKQLNSGQKILLVMSRHKWKDGLGSHLVEHCRWLQTPANKQVWNTCLDHNVQIQ